MKTNGRANGNVDAVEQKLESDYADRLKSLSKQLCRCEQDVLKDLADRAVSADDRSRYQTFINSFTEHLINGEFYSKIYDPMTEEIAITTPDGRTMNVTVEEDNLHTFRNNDLKEELTVWLPPPFCIPITADVRTYNFTELARTQRQLRGGLYDVIVTDPPWQLATHNPTRGVALGYNQLGDDFLLNIPFGEMQDPGGLIFIWVINAKFELALEILEKNGYDHVDEVVWVKTTVNRRIARSHGFYLQHGKETCIVGQKRGDSEKRKELEKKFKPNSDSDVLFAQRTGQSQKPVDLYEMIERLVPNGSYLEIFGRRNNLRNFWTTIGNEL